MGLKQDITRSLKRYDGDLFCDHNPNGVLCVFRKVKRFVPVCETDGFSLKTLVEAREFVFALTDTWNLRGKPRSWGVDHILNRLREIDLQAQEKFFEAMEEAEEKAAKTKRKDFRNEAEAFWADHRKEFIKATDAVYGTTVSLSKDEPKKRLRDRSIKNGNC